MARIKKRLTDLVPPEPAPPPRPSSPQVYVNSKELREKQKARRNPSLDRHCTSAYEKLEPHLTAWIHYPLSVGKRPLLEAYRELSQLEKEALAQEVVEAFEEHHGCVSCVAYRKRQMSPLSGTSLTTSLDEMRELDPNAIEVYVVPAEAVMLHWSSGLFDDRTVDHDREIILRPGCGDLLIKLEYNENPGVDPAERITNLVKRLGMRFPDGLVPLSEVRKVMPDVRPQDFDRALATLQAKKKIIRQGDSIKEAPLAILEEEPEELPKKAAKPKPIVTKKKPLPVEDLDEPSPPAPSPRLEPIQMPIQEAVAELLEPKLPSPRLEEAPRQPPYAQEPSRAPSRAGLVKLPPQTVELAPVPSVPTLGLPEVPGALDQNPAAVWLASLAPGTQRSARGSLEILARELGGTPETIRWQDLRYQHTQALRARLAAKYVYSYANKIIYALKGVLRQAMLLGKMPPEAYERAKSIEPIKGTRVPKGRALSFDELKRLFASLDASTPHGARDAAILAVLYGAGLRRSEVVLLSVSDDEGNALRIHGKGNKERLVPIGEDVRRALDRWKEYRGPTLGPLFLPIGRYNRIINRQLTDQSILYILDKIEHASHVKQFSPHDLRRTYISDLLDAGNDIVTVQKLVGHSGVNTTARYDRRGEVAKQKAVATIRVPVDASEQTAS